MTDIFERPQVNKNNAEFGKYSWIKPALVFAAIGASIYGIIVSAPYLVQMIEEVFMFLMFFGLLG